MDILLTPKGDLYVTEKGDIAIVDSVAQKIKIRLRWWLGEWRWDRDLGLPYREYLFDKNPDTDAFEMAARQKIFEVEEVTEVGDVRVVYDSRTRESALTFTAKTDKETIRGEVKIDGAIRGN